MLLISKRTRLSLYSTLAFCSGMYLTNAMERPTSEIEKKTEEEQETFLANIPKEIKTNIISFLVSAKNAKEAIRNIKALAATSKKFNTLINDPSVLGSLIEALSKRFNVSPIQVTMVFKNPSAAYLLKGYLQGNPQEKELLNQYLLKAAKNDNINIAEVLLKAGADVNQLDGEGGTLLYRAAYKGSKDTVELLLKYGANVNKGHIFGYTPLGDAASAGYKDIVELLIHHGANVNIANEYGYTDLHRAASTGKKNIVELLLKAGADVNAASYDNGTTPLDEASCSNHQDIVKLLLKHGAKRGRESCTIL
jgi:uncharacterized protein